MNDFSHLIGADFGTVTVLKELGRGNMAAVFLAFQRTLKRQVAVKVLAKSGLRDHVTAEQFRDEAEMIAGLSHPNIIPIFEMGETGEYYFQVMQLVDGSDLHTMIRRRLRHPVPARRTIPVAQALSIALQTISGLAYAHDEGIVHQDIKPANILVEDRTGRPLIADFGIAKAQRSVHESQGLIIGTPFYLSPEQAGARPTDRRTDIYSMGVILFELLAGTLPVREENVQEMLVRKLTQPQTLFTARPRDTSPCIDEELEEIILRATAVRPIDRYQDCHLFHDDLERYRLQHPEYQNL